MFFLFFLGHVVDSEQCKEIEERENKDVIVQDDREDPSEANVRAGMMLAMAAVLNILKLQASVFKES